MKPAYARPEPIKTFAVPARLTGQIAQNTGDMRMANVENSIVKMYRNGAEGSTKLVHFQTQFMIKSASFVQIKKIPVLPHSIDPSGNLDPR